LCRTKSYSAGKGLIRAKQNAFAGNTILAGLYTAVFPEQNLVWAKNIAFRRNTVLFRANVVLFRKDEHLFFQNAILFIENEACSLHTQFCLSQTKFRQRKTKSFLSTRSFV